MYGEYEFHTTTFADIPGYWTWTEILGDIHTGNVCGSDGYCEWGIPVFRWFETVSDILERFFYLLERGEFIISVYFIWTFRALVCFCKMDKEAL